MHALRLNQPHVPPKVIEELVVAAGPGGPHEGTLLLVFGDHGQTLGGDHGGGTREEVDSAIFALSPAKLHRARAAYKDLG